MWTNKMRVGRVDDQGDRVLLYASESPRQSLWGEYHVIAPAGCTVKPGDTVEYEDWGVNFGFLAAPQPQEKPHEGTE